MLFTLSWKQLYLILLILLVFVIELNIVLVLILVIVIFTELDRYRDNQTLENFQKITRLI